MKKAVRWALGLAGVSVIAVGAYAVHDLRSSPLWFLQSCADTAYAPASWVCEQSLFSQHPTPQELAEMNQQAGALAAVYQVKEENARRFLKHYLEAGLDINAVDQRSALRWTALHSMVLGPDVAAIRVLLDHGASPSIPDAEGRTALDIARHQHAKRPTPESAEVVRLLEQAGQRASGS